MKKKNTAYFKKKTPYCKPTFKKSQYTEEQQKFLQCLIFNILKLHKTNSTN